MFRLIGRCDLADDPRYQHAGERKADQELLEAAIADWAASRGRDEIGDALRAIGVPYAPVASIAEVAASDQIAAREMISEIDHPSLGPLRLPSSPIKMSATPPTIRKAPPLAGEDNDRVYGELLGMSDEEIAVLRAEGAI
jgi:crotonobetainyl-CoA:carnitine CoA-transferase CaiB-like acyl-CoA transferase